MWNSITNQNRPRCGLKTHAKSRLQKSRVIISGFSLVELMITTTIVSILAGVAIPSYINYTKRGEVADALSTLLNLTAQMEKNYLDERSYATDGKCAVADLSQHGFDFSCELTNEYTWTAKNDNYTYTIDQAGNKSTTKIPDSTSSFNCWKVIASGACY